MVTCMILAAQIVLTTPLGAIIIPSDAIVTIAPDDGWGATGTVIKTDWRQITIDAPVDEITAALATCKVAAK